MHPDLALHARPAAKLVQLARQFSASITIEKEGKRASAVSPISIMGIDAGKGSTVTVAADGEDEVEAVARISQFLSDGG